MLSIVSKMTIINDILGIFYKCMPENGVFVRKIHETINSDPNITTHNSRPSGTGYVF